MQSKPELSIIILEYNTKELLADCLKSIKKCENEVSFEVIVSDNASQDGSAEMVRKDFPWVKVMEGENVGFSKGNNRARHEAKGDMILFLNPDTIVNKDVLKETVAYLKEHKDVGVVTCKLVLPSGEVDKDARRSYPTPWVALTHLVLKLDRIFPKSKLFARYWYGWIPENVTHEVEAVQGAFFLTWKKILDSVGWFDEDYFFNAEDIDLCWKIHEKGWKLIYYPKVFIYHVKGASKGKSKKWKHKVPFAHRLKMRLIEVTSMEIFYRKRLWNRYPLLLNWFVIFGIRVYKGIRFLSVVLSS
jgi:GT2 family glycosyltransferase